jgi:hypothetical protein
MRKFSYVLGCLLGASSLVTALPSYADIPPRDACMEKGSTCDNVGGDEKPGVCVVGECFRRMADGTYLSYDCLRCVAPGGEGGASAGGAGGAGGEVTDPPVTGGTTSATGGTTSATGGTTNTAGGPTQATGGTTNSTGGTTSSTGGTTSSTGGTTSSTGGASGEAGKSHDDDGGCSVSPLRAERGLAALMTAVGLAALLVSRRRR